MAFCPGGECLPYDWVDEGKLLLFVKTQVAERAPRKGSRRPYCKNNQHGRREYGAALRHWDPQSCLIGALAIYLFWRWHRSGEAFPCFQESQDWYPVRLLKRDNAHLQEQLNSDTAADWSKRLYSVAGLRMSNSRRPASGESSTAGLAILGSLAGGASTERVESNLAAGAFLELLDRLRDVLLQDAALLRREFPQHDLFNDPIFATSEYAEFEAAVTTAVEVARDEDPHLVAVQKALPAVCDSLRTVTGVVKTGLESNDSSMRDLCSKEDLDERWGSRWRHGAEFQFYSRRKVVVTEIKRLVAGGREAREVVDSLEAERVRAKASLNQVINRLKAAARQGRDGIDV
ncbi:hypothetical protein V8E54_000191 [Elaphomyces granulatus]